MSSETELDILDPDVFSTALEREIEIDSDMDTDKEVTRRLLDGHEGSSYTDLPGIRISKDGSLARVEALHEPEPESETGTSLNPFADPEVAERYAALYEKAKYECRHVFDPTMTWTREEERRLVRKIDAKVCLWAVRPPTLPDL